ncbi:MAG: dephospho-CoA kinase, partial [Clostridia bacterium]|nr:dephospho-CoA kinase [Clostridia bacterium]
ITHKHINKRVIELIEENEKKGKKIVLIDVPLMFESEFNKMCDVVICVTADYETKIQRIMKRDKITREKAEKRLRSQMSDDELRKLSDYEIVNDSKRDVTAQVSDLAKKLFKV